MIDLGSGHRVCCFGRTGPILYSNVRSSSHGVTAARHTATRHTAARHRLSHATLLAVRGVQVSMLHATVARQAVEDDLANVTKLYTGSQWVILDRAFSTYLVTAPAAQRWMRVYERRFLSDEGFLHTALMHSPHRHTLVNTNLRYIMWPHHHEDPTSYWARMGYSFIGGPEVINATEAPKVGRSHAP